MKSFRFPLWIKGGCAGLLVLFLYTLVINPLLEPLRANTLGFVFSEIVGAPMLIISIPLYILFSFLGFAVDALLNTGMGYESLGIFVWGVVVMKIVTAAYFFFLGWAVFAFIHRKRKK